MAFKKAGGFGARRTEGGYGRSERSPRAGGRSFERKPFGKSGGRGQLELFNATCAQCGRETQVPFKPTGAKPVLCRDCFKGESAPRRFESPAKASDDTADELRRINEKLDKIMESLGIE